VLSQTNLSGYLFFIDHQDSQLLPSGLMLVLTAHSLYC